MRNIRKLFCTFLVVALIALSVAPALAEIRFDSSDESLYLPGTGSVMTSTYGYYIDDMEENSKVTGLKSSNKAVLSIYGLSYYSGSSEYYEGGSDYSYHDANIMVKPKKAGNATVSFKVGKQSFKKKFTVLNYSNPVKSLVLTGVGKKNLKGNFAKGNRATASLSSNAKAGYVQVAAASGWKIQNVRWEDNSDYSRREHYHGNVGVSSVKMEIPPMKKDVRYNVTVQFVNVKTQGRLSVRYELAPAA